MSGKIREMPRLEVHTHSYVSGPNANKSWLSKVEHSHEGADIPHTHPDTGPGAYTIDKDEWAARTGLKGGGRKKFTAKPTGPQLDYIERPAHENTFRVIFMDEYTDAHASADISRERWEGERADFIEAMETDQRGGYTAERMIQSYGMKPIYILDKPGA